MKRILAGALLLVLLLGGGAAWLDYRRFLDSTLPVPAGGLDYLVAPGSSVGVLAADLQQRGVLRRALWFELYARLHGLAGRIQAGEYRIEPLDTPRALLDRWVAGRVIVRSFTVPEGWTFAQIRAALATLPKVGQTLAGLDDAQVMERLGEPGLAPEGRFFPDTYRYQSGTPDLELLRQMRRALERQLAAAWVRRAPDSPLKTPDEALVLASIVEKETGLPAERRQVAGVYARRLALGMPLQADPTVLYGRGAAADGELTRSDLRSDGPYNTYTRKGLPPTPIAAPGAAALAAAVDPAPGDALYFVARGDGGHVFSATLEDHQRAVRDYRARRAAASRGESE